MAKHTLKILRCSCCKLFRVYLAIFQHDAWKSKPYYSLSAANYVTCFDCKNMMAAKIQNAVSASFFHFQFFVTQATFFDSVSFTSIAPDLFDG